MKITTVGIDLAKMLFQIHGVDERSKTVVRKQLKRAEMSVYFANLEPCLIGMEACGSAHYWVVSSMKGVGRAVPAAKAATATLSGKLGQQLRISEHRDRSFR